MSMNTSPDYTTIDGCLEIITALEHCLDDKEKEIHDLKHLIKLWVPPLYSGSGRTS